MAKKSSNAKKQPELIATEIVETLSELGSITQRKMFGGIGVFCDGKMFALVNSGATPFLKTNDALAARFEKLGAQRFGKMRYHEIPQRILSQPAQLLEWAQDSIDLAHEN